MEKSGLGHADFRLVVDLRFSSFGRSLPSLLVLHERGNSKVKLE